MSFMNPSSLGAFGTQQTTTVNVNPMKDFEVTSPPEDSVSSLRFSPPSLPQIFLIAGSWDCNVSILKLNIFRFFLKFY